MGLDELKAWDQACQRFFGQLSLPPRLAKIAECDELKAGEKPREHEASGEDKKTMNLDELKRLEAQATPGPWETLYIGYGWIHAVIPYPADDEALEETDLRFLCALRNAAPDLFERIKELEEDKAVLSARLAEQEEEILKLKATIPVLQKCSQNETSEIEPGLADHLDAICGLPDKIKAALRAAERRSDGQEKRISEDFRGKT